MFKDAVWARLRREDMILQAISREMAKQSRSHHVTRSGEDHNFAGDVKPGLNADYVAGVPIAGRFCNSAIKTFCAKTLSGTGLFATQKIAGRAGVAGPFVKQPRKLVKLGNEVNDAWKARFLADGLDHARRMPRSWPDQKAAGISNSRGPVQSW